MPAGRQVSPSTSAISVARARLGSALRTEKRPSLNVISAFLDREHPRGADRERTDEAQLVDARGARSRS